MISYTNFLVLSIILFTIAIYGITTRRNGISFVVSTEIIINAALINFVYGAVSFNSIKGLGYAIVILIISVLETTIILSMLIIYNKRTGSLMFSKLRRIKG